MDSVDFLEGQLLIAMPTMSDPRFARSLVYICAHSSDGAMGLVVNKQADFIEFSELLERLNITSGKEGIKIDRDDPVRKVHFGGPVETGRGFVLHSSDYTMGDNTLAIDNKVALTATLDILREIATGKGPRKSFLALGYAGWSPGQLEAEMLQNGWLHCMADEDLLFGRDIETKYDAALAKLGIDPALLSVTAGQA